MSVRLLMDDSEFQKTLKAYLAVSRRTLPQALNEKMFWITRRASVETPATNKFRIESELNVIGYELRYNKKGAESGHASQSMIGKSLYTESFGSLLMYNRIDQSSMGGVRILKSKKIGRVRTGAAQIGGALIYKIINARRTFAGKPGLKRQEMKERAQKILAARFRSVNTLKAGWWGALTALGKAIGKPHAFERTTNRVKNPSVVEIAREGFTPRVSLEYKLLAKDKNYQRSIDQKVTKALSAGWFHEMASMRDYIEKKLSGELKKADNSVPKKTTNLSSVMAEGAKNAL